MIDPDIEQLFDDNLIADGNINIYPANQATLSAIKDDLEVDVNLTRLSQTLSGQQSNRDALDLRADVVAVRSVRDLVDLEKNDPLRVVFYQQNPWAIPGADPANPTDAEVDAGVQAWFDAGLRVHQLVWSATAAALPHGAYASTDDAIALTDIGERTANALLDRSVMLDVSHLGTASAQRVIELARARGAPAIASHVNAFGEYPVNRNHVDAVLENIARSGGIIGVMPLRKFVGPAGSTTIDDVIDHIDHIRGLVVLDDAGTAIDMIDHITVASDAGPDGSVPGTNSFISADLSSRDRWKILATALLESNPPPADPGHDPNRPWYSLDDIAKVFGGNLIRVLRGALPPRAPVNTMLVLDRSGSMNRPAPGGDRIKMDLLKDAVELFIETLRPFSIYVDRVGLAYFADNVDGLPAGAPALVRDGGFLDDASADLRGQAPGGFTAMGGGILSGVTRLDSLQGDKHIIVFTDGVQNVNPMAAIWGDSLALWNDPSVERDTGLGQMLPVEVDQSGVRIHTIGVGVAGNAYEALLADIASATGGVSHFTNDPDDELEALFMSELVETLQGNTPRLVRSGPGTATSDSHRTESVVLNADTRKAVFVLSSKSGREGLSFSLARPDTAEVAQIVTKQGRFYQITTVDFPPGSTSHAGHWQMEIASKRDQAEYRFYVLADDHGHDFDFWIGRSPVPRPGRPLTVHAVVKKSGRPLAHPPVKITAEWDYPDTPIGDLYASLLPETKPVRRSRSKGGNSDGSRAIAPAIEGLWAHPEFASRVDRGSESIELHYDGDSPHGEGLFSGAFTKTPHAGSGRVRFTVVGTEDENLFRTARRDVVLRMGPFDQRKSVLRVERSAEADHMVTYRLELRPVDLSGHLLGPGFGQALRFRLAPRRYAPQDSENHPPQLLVPQVEDALDGRYLIALPSTDLSSRTLQVDLSGDTILKISLPE